MPIGLSLGTRSHLVFPEVWHSPRAQFASGKNFLDALLEFASKQATGLTLREAALMPEFKDFLERTLKPVAGAAEFDLTQATNYDTPATGVALKALEPLEAYLRHYYWVKEAMKARKKSWWSKSLDLQVIRSLEAQLDWVMEHPSHTHVPPLSFFGFPAKFEAKFRALVADVAKQGRPALMSLPAGDYFSVRDRRPLDEIAPVDVVATRKKILASVFGTRDLRSVEIVRLALE